ncbi:hypothetical protein D3C72_1463020 [compost metagenome]
MQQRQGGDVLSLFDGMSAEELRAAHRRNHFMHQKGAFRPRPVRLADMDRHIQLLALEVELADAGGEINGDFRMVRHEIRDTRQKPTGAEGGQHGEVQRIAMRFGHDLQRRGPYLAEGGGNRFRISATLGRQRHAARTAFKQAHAKLFFQ